MGGSGGIITSGGSNLGIRSEGELHIATNGNNRAITIETSGEVGIGITAPENLLHIYGDPDNTPMLNLQHTDASDRIILEMEHPSLRMGIANNGAGFKVMNITSDTDHVAIDADGTFTATDTSISEISDERTKKNIQTYSGSLSIINTLRPVTYEWKSDRKKSGRRRGFIAQEVTSSDAFWVASSSVDPGQPDWEYLDGTPQINIAQP